MSVLTLKEILATAQKNNFAVGSFAPRNLCLIGMIMDAAQDEYSPVIVQISSVELTWAGVDCERFAERFYSLAGRYTVPICLHLDHTFDMEVIRSAVASRFTSVMIDASQYPFDENVKRTKEAADYAHAYGVSVEAELGRLRSYDKFETEDDALLYTVPEEAALFADQTGADALAISIGTAHGVYPVANPKIDFERLGQIRSMVKIPLVLHGGSGLPNETVHKAATFPGGGVSKINIATDLELAFLKALGHSGRLSEDEYGRRFDGETLRKAGQAVKKAVRDKISGNIFSTGTAKYYGA